MSDSRVEAPNIAAGDVVTVVSVDDASKWLVVSAAPWASLRGECGLKLDLIPAPPEAVHASAFAEGLANPDVGELGGDGNPVAIGLLLTVCGAAMGGIVAALLLAAFGGG